MDKQSEGKIAAIIMDMDGVLVDSPRFHLMAWRKALQGININISDLDSLLREGGKDEDITMEIAQSKKLWLSREQVDHVCLLKRQFFEDLFIIRPVEGILDFIDALNSIEHKLALVTGTVSKTAFKIIETLSLDSRFDVVITGDMLNSSKPDPEPYLKAIQYLGISPSEGIVIENAPAGILSAKRAGLLCVALATSLPDEFLREADFVFQNVPAMQEWFFDRIHVNPKA